MEDISSILQNLTSQDMDQLKSIADGLFGSNSNNNQPNTNENNNGGGLFGLGSLQNNQQQSSPLSDMNIDPAMMLKIGNIMQQFNQKDERCDFLYSIKPLLSEKKKKKVDDAAKILRLLTMLPTLRELGIF